MIMNIKKNRRDGVLRSAKLKPNFSRFSRILELPFPFDMAVISFARLVFLKAASSQSSAAYQVVVWCFRNFPPGLVANMRMIQNRHSHAGIIVTKNHNEFRVKKKRNRIRQQAETLPSFIYSPPPEPPVCNYFFRSSYAKPMGCFPSSLHGWKNHARLPALVLHLDGNVAVKVRQESAWISCGGRALKTVPIS
jgi:hypothetical protein